MKKETNVLRMIQRYKVGLTHKQRCVAYGLVPCKVISCVVLFHKSHGKPGKSLCLKDLFSDVRSENTNHA